MDADFRLHRRGEFPADQPMEGLKADHNFVRQLFDRYFQTQDANEKIDTGRHILLLLEMHASLEEGVFYPRVRNVDPALIDRCELEHDHASQLIARLKIMDEADPQAVETFRQLAAAVFKHIETEERHVFPKVRQANLDLSAIGHEMLALETRLTTGPSRRHAVSGLRQ